MPLGGMLSESRYPRNWCTGWRYCWLPSRYSDGAYLRIPRKVGSTYRIWANHLHSGGICGVDSGQSAYQKIINGASLVQLYTGMIYQGPSIALKISKELINILDKEGVKNISDAVGSKN